MEKKNTLLIKQISYIFISFLVLLTQSGFRPTPQDTIPPINWDIPDAKEWPPLKPEGEFDVNKFCDSSSGLARSEYCHGDQVHAYYEIVEKNVTIATVFLVDGKRFVVREVDGKYYISCFPGVGDGPITMPYGEKLISQEEFENIKHTINDYEKKGKQVKESFDIIQSFAQTYPAINYVCGIAAGLAGAGAGTAASITGPGLVVAVILAAGGTLYGCIQAASALIGKPLDKYVTAMMNIISQYQEFQAISERIRSYKGLPACVNPGEY